MEKDGEKKEDRSKHIVIILYQTSICYKNEDNSEIILLTIVVFHKIWLLNTKHNTIPRAATLELLADNMAILVSPSYARQQHSTNCYVVPRYNRPRSIIRDRYFYVVTKEHLSSENKTDKYYLRSRKSQDKYCQPVYKVLTVIPVGIVGNR